MKKIGILVVGALLALAACTQTTKDVAANTPDATTSSETLAAPTTSYVPPPPPAPTTPPMTVGQMNALSKAKDYLNYTAFSRSGLIQQLQYEGFEEADATFAVDKLNPDWNEQAGLKAKDYMNYTSFSRQGLIQQLEYEGFTPAEAEYGASQVGF